MLIELSANSLPIREWINGALFPISACLAVVIASFLLTTWKETKRGFLRVPGVTTALALFWVFSAGAFWTGSVWLILRLRTSGVEIAPQMQNLFEIGWVLSGMLLCLMMTYCIYLFTPPKCGHRVWVGCVIGASLLLIFSETLARLGY